MKIETLFCVVENKSRKVHVISVMKFSPALCGKEPKYKRGMVATWSVLKKSVIKSIINKKQIGRHLKFCEKCMKIAIEGTK